MQSTTSNPDHVAMRQTTIFDDTVASRIEALLARCEGVRRGSTINRPILFAAAGQRHAREVAQLDLDGQHELNEGLVSKPQSTAIPE